MPVDVRPRAVPISTCKCSLGSLWMPIPSLHLESVDNTCPCKQSEGVGELDINVRDDPTLSIISLVHGQSVHSRADVSTWVCLNQHERLIEKDHKTKAGIEPTSSKDRSNILPIHTIQFSLHFLSIFSSSCRREEDYSITLLLLAQLQFPKQKKVILLLRIGLKNDSLSCAYEYASHWWSITLSQ